MQSSPAPVHRDMPGEGNVPAVSPLGNRVHPLGKVAVTTPIAPLEESTEYIDAGSIKFGLEYRELNEDVLEQNFGHDPAELARVKAMHAEGGLPDDTGLSLHVIDAADDREMLRFDMFGDDPHYHYMPPEPYHILVVYDVATNGNMFTWTMSAVRNRLDLLLANAGYPALAASYDKAAVAAALNEITERASKLKVSVPGGPAGSVLGS